MAFGRLAGFHGGLGGGCREGGRNPRYMKPLGTGHDLVPVDQSRFDGGNGGIFAVVQDARSPWGGAKLKKIEADPIIGCKQNMAGIDPRFPGVIGDKAAQRIVRETGNPSGFAAKPSYADRGV